MARIVSYGLLVISAVLLLFSAYLHFEAGFYGDKAWELLCSRQWLEGKILYRDIFAVSPPLIVWLYAVPVWLSQHFNRLAAFEWLVLSGLVLIAGSLYLCLRVLCLNIFFREKRILATAGVLFCFLLIFRTSPIFFLDREHLFFVMILPYLLRFMPQIYEKESPRLLSVSIGILAGIGFAIKPQCVIIAGGIQLGSMFWRKSWRGPLATENMALGATGLTYLTAAWLLYPDYFHTVIPMALATYSATRDENSVFTYAGNSLSVLVAAFVLFPWTKPSPIRLDIFYLLTLCPFFLFYALANNNWSYTYYPLNSFTLLVSGFVLAEFIILSRKSRDWKHRLWFGAGIVLCSGDFLFKLFLSFQVFQFVLADPCLGNPHCGGPDVFSREVMTEDKPHSFGTISMDFSRWTRLGDYTGALWETRFPQLWMLPKFFVSDDAFYREHAWIIAYLGKAYAYDLDHNMPEVMFVDDSDKFYTAHMEENLVSYLSVVPEFRAAWAHYHLRHKINFCPPGGPYPHKFQCSYDVYLRTP